MTLRRCVPGKSLALSLALAAGLVPGLAVAGDLANCATQDAWRRFDTSHFILYSNAPPEEALASAKQLETFAWMLEKRSPGLADPGGPRMIAFGFASGGDYAPFRARFEGKPIESLGMFLPGPLGKFFIYAMGRGEEDTRVIYHEYLHALTHDQMGHAPPCVKEGIADFFSTFSLKCEDATFGHPIPGYCWMLQHETPMSMDRLFGIGHDREYFQGEKRGLMYAESWTLVHYLVRQASSATFERFAAALQSGEPAHDAFARVYPAEDWVNLPWKLKAYADASELDSFRMPLGVSFEGARVESRPAERAEILTALGDLLVQEERFASEAPAYYRAALAEQGEYPPAICGLAEINAQRGFHQQADQLFRRSAASKGADARTLAACARGIRRAALADTTLLEDASAAAIESARKVAQAALKLDPAEPLALATVAEGVDDDTTAAAWAIEPLEEAHRRFPARIVVIEGLVRAYARAGRVARAESLLASEPKLASTRGGERAQAAIEQAGLRDAQALLRQGRMAEGAAVLQRLRTGTKDPGFARFLDERLQAVSEVVSSNQWVDRYNEGILEANRGNLERALALFQEVHAKSPDPALVLESSKLIERIQKAQRQKSGSKRRAGSSAP